MGLWLSCRFISLVHIITYLLWNLSVQMLVLKDFEESLRWLPFLLSPLRNLICSDDNGLVLRLTVTLDGLVGAVPAFFQQLQKRVQQNWV